MRSFCIVVILFFAIGVTSQECTTVTVINGDFSTPVCGSKWCSFVEDDDDLGWSILSGDVEITSNRYFNAYSGNQSLDLNGKQAGTISQTIAVQSGVSYVLAFYLAGNPNRIHACTGTDPVKKLTLTYGSSSMEVSC